MSRRTHSLLAVALSAGLLAAACGGGDPAPDQAGGEVQTASTLAGGPPEPGGTLVFAIGSETDGWDPTRARWPTAGMTVAMALYDPLFAWAADGTVQPYLAESATPNADFTEWVVTVREGVTFHDGTPVTGASLQVAFEAIRSATLTGSAVQLVERVEVSGPRSVTVVMSEPWVQFPASLTAQAGVLVAESTLTTPEGPRNPVGTGPFKLKEWIPNDRIVLERNEDYWLSDADGVQLPYLDEIEFRPIPDNQSRVAALEAGDVDVLSSTDPASLGLLRASAQAGDIQYVPDEGESEENFVMFNLDAAPTNDVHLRRALAYATDPARYAETANIAPDRVADGPFIAGSPWDADVPFPHADMARAREELATHQAANGGAPVTITLSSLATPEASRESQAIAAQWEELGVSVQLQSVESTKFIAEVVGGNFQAAMWRRFGSPDPDGDYHFWTSETALPVGQLALNMARFRDEALDEALLTGRSSTSDGQRRDAYRVAQQRWADQVPYIWLDHARWGTAAALNVRGIGNNPLPDGRAAQPFVVGAFRTTGLWLDR